MISRVRDSLNQGANFRGVVLQESGPIADNGEGVTMKRSKLFTALIAAGFVFSGLTNTNAAVVSTNLSVTATVVAACRNVSTTPVSFGSYNNVDKDATGTVSVNCLEGTSYGIRMHGGNAFNILAQQRQMQSGSDRIGYQLFKEAARANVWGSCRGFCPLQATAVEAVGTGSPQTFTVFGRAFRPGFLQPNPQPGAYTDAVLVEVDF
jgi:spore coat protein U-like protein